MAQSIQNHLSAQTQNYLAQWKLRLEQLLSQQLRELTAGCPPVFHQALEYGLLNGGKKFRPLLIYALGTAYQIPLSHLDSAACAIEMIHSFSLIHDDLPAMDNDQLRRGQPTCHIAFDEATAILVGDALSILALQIIAIDSNLNCSQKMAMIQTLTTATGPQGIAGGQYLDLHPPHPPTLSTLEQTYFLKTGKLIEASFHLGIIAANLPADHGSLQVWTKLARSIGMAFQIRDDLLNIESQPEIIGKGVGTDVAQGKTTYPALVGIAEAKAELRRLELQITEILQDLKLTKSFLADLIKTVIRI